MRHLPRRPPAAFTLVELLSVLFVLSLLAVMSVRSLGVVLDSREQMAQDAEKWRGLALFFERFERDVHLAMPRAARQSGVALPAWQGIAGAAAQPRLEFNRFAAAAEMDGATRWQSLRYITLPALRDVIATALLLRIIWVANSLDVILVMTGGGPGFSTHTLPLYAFLKAYSSMDFGYASALSLVLTLLLLLAVAVYVRRIAREVFR